MVSGWIGRRDLFGLNRVENADHGIDRDRMISRSDDIEIG